MTTEPPSPANTELREVIENALEHVYFPSYRDASDEPAPLCNIVTETEHKGAVDTIASFVAAHLIFKGQSHD